MALSANGKQVVIGMVNETAELWDLSARKKLQQFPGGKVALSADGKRVATSANGDEAAVWDTVTGKLIHNIEGHKDKITSLALSADGERLLTGSEDQTAILWDSTGKVLQTFQGHNGKVTGVALSADGKKVATGSEDKTAIIWDDTGRQLQTLEFHNDAITCVALTANGQHVVTGSKDERAILWDAATGKQLQTFGEPIGHDGFEVENVAVSADGQRVVTGAENGVVTQWSSKTGRAVSPLSRHSPAADMALTSDGRRMALSFTHDTVLVWDVATGALLRTVKSLHGDDKKLALSTHGTHGVVGTRDPGIVPQLSPTRWLSIAANAARYGVSVSADGQRVATSSSALIAISLDLEGSKHLGTVGGGAAQDALDDFFTAREANGGMIALLNRKKEHPPLSDLKQLQSQVEQARNRELKMRDNAAIIWDTATGEPHQIFMGHEGSVTSVALADDGQMLLTGSEDGTAILWDASGEPLQFSPSILQTFRGHKTAITTVALSADGKRGATGSDDKTAIIWDVADDMPLQVFQGHQDSVSSVAMTTDGKRLVTGSLDETAIIWNASTGEMLQSFQVNSKVTRVAVCANDTRLWTASVDGVMRLWDVSTGEELCTLLSFYPDDWLVVSSDGYYDGTDDAVRETAWRETDTGRVIVNESTRRAFRRRGLLGELLKGGLP